MKKQPSILLRQNFQASKIKACHSHLAQNVYRKIQLSTRYENDENFSLLTRHIPALAFLAPDAIPAAFDQLRDNIPEEAGGIIQWFDNNYVNGKLRRTLRDGSQIRIPPLFPPIFWSVVEDGKL